MVRENIGQNRRFPLVSKEIPTSPGLAGAPGRQVGAPATGQSGIQPQGARV